MLNTRKKILISTVALSLNLISHAAFSQNNILSTNPVAEQVMLGNYDPATFTPPVILNRPDTIINGIMSRVSSDSLLSDLIKLATFQNRNTGSDTVSSTKGIGAARRWVYQKFQEISSQNNNRLIPSYLQFDSTLCTIKQHRSPFAVLPGLDTTDPSIIIVESHLDSRCEVLCDTSCVAQGVDDNGSGTALVIELARVLSRYAFRQTIVFLTNIGEEQGLDGAVAFAVYAQQKNILIKAVQNNDIVGGVLCGHSSSPPSCPGFGDIDSTQFRMFSFGGINSAHKGFARWIKLEYRENLLPLTSVPMTLTIMTAEDRTGRGGDHIPFRQKGYTAMRFTCANENGNANVADTGYHDNQHTSRDVLGYDTNGDGSIDSFLVDVHYLARNTQVNANAAAMAAIGVLTPDFSFSVSGNDLQITITNQTQYAHYRVGIRSTTFDFDSVYTINGTVGTIHLANTGTYFTSVASVDSNGIESFFSDELLVSVTGIHSVATQKGIYFLPMKPNPADDATMISFYSDKPVTDKEAFIRITDTNGILEKQLPLTINQGVNEVLYKHSTRQNGTFVIQLLIDGKAVANSRIVFSH